MRLRLRQCWGCDCDGVSHLAGIKPKGAQAMAVDGMAKSIEHLTGYRPPTCPWRAMWDPLVAKCMDVVRRGDKGLGHMVEADPPAILDDALSVYLRSKEMVKSHDDAEEHKRELAKLKGKRG